MKRRIRVKTTNPMTHACTGPHLPTTPSLGPARDRPLVDETGRPLNIATGSDIDRIVGMDRNGYPVPKGSAKDITKNAKLVRYEDDPPDPFGPEGDLVEPQPDETTAIRERYGLDANGFPLPDGVITDEQRAARGLRYGTNDADAETPGDVRVDYQTDRVQFEGDAA
jgi:hypothetical protein